MKNLILILGFAFSGILHSQEKKDTICGLRTANEKWKLEFKKAESKSERIDLIKQKLISDSIYVETKPIINTVHGRINSHEDKDGNYCGCKISFILAPKRKGGFYNLNLNSRPNLIDVVNSLDETNVENIFYILENDNPALRPSGICGVVKMTTKDDELIKSIKNVW